VEEASILVVGPGGGSREFVFPDDPSSALEGGEGGTKGNEEEMSGARGGDEWTEERSGRRRSFEMGRRSW